MSAAPRRHHDFRRVTDITSNRASDGDTLYRMSSHYIDTICQTIYLDTQGVSDHERSE